MSKPKSGVIKKPDSHWDYIVQGDDVVSALGNKIEGHEKLKGTKLRIKKPGKLGVDADVKQYSGYLDVDDDDKHFFFCKFSPRESGYCSIPSTITNFLTFRVL